MAELVPLVAAPPTVLRLTTDGLRIGPTQDMAVFTLKLGPRVDAGRLGEAIGVALPGPGRSLIQDGPQWLNVGPRAWLVTVAPAAAADLAGRVRDRLGDASAVLTEVSDALVICDVIGERAEALLAQGVSLDLDLRLPPGHVARTRLGAIAVTLVRDGGKAFRVIAPRPYAGYLAAWLDEAAREEIAAS